MERCFLNAVFDDFLWIGIDLQYTDCEYCYRLELFSFVPSINEKCFDRRESRRMKCFIFADF